MREFSRISEVKPQKKIIFITKTAKKTVLAHEFWGDNQYLGSLRPRTALQWHHRLFISRLETDNFVFFSSRFTDSISLSKSQFLSTLVAP